MKFGHVAAIVVCFAMTGVVFAGENVSLAGKWRFAVDQGKAGVTEEWFKKDLADSIKLPGTMDDAGLGPKNTAAPTLAGPYRLYNYAGPAWYQRDIEIPESWTGKRVTLFLERCRWVTTVWLDDKKIGSQDSLIAPHFYDLGIDVAPGKHRLSICVDNTVKLELGTFVSVLFGGTHGNMNGIIGRIELSSTPPVWLEDVQVYPDVDKMAAKVKVRIGNASGKAGKGTLKAGTKTSDVTWDDKGGAAELEVDMAGAKLWDEFEPNLSEVTVTLDSGNGSTDERKVTFGMRKFEAKGTQFTMNGRPVFLRGTLECSVWPLTGYPPTDVPAWQRIFQVVKSYGLNHVRFHTWCPPDAAFSAADIEGVILQPEPPNNNNAGQVDRDIFVEAELKRIVDTYGNHPSFCKMTLGNECGGGMIHKRWVEMLMERDTRHLYSSSSAGEPTSNRQFTVAGTGRGIHGAGTQRDLRGVVAGDARPIVGHEIGQWAFWPDSREIKKWSGVMALKNFEIVRDDLQKKHLLDLEPQFVEALGQLSLRLYKEEIEQLLRTPGYGGFALLDLHDYPTQGSALIGVLNAFWDSKGFISPGQWRRFCSPTVPLLRIPKRTYTANESFEAMADLAHYGPADLPNVKPVWTIKDEQGREIASGTLPEVAVPTGKLTPLGTIKASLTNAVAPCKLTVTVALDGTQFANDWNIWTYPAVDAPQPPADVAVCTLWEDATAALASGKKVVLFPRHAHPRRSLRGSFLPVFWSPVWFPDSNPGTMSLLCNPKHPLFAQFPTGFHSDWQWYNLMQYSREFILNDTPATYRPLVQVIDNFSRNHKVGVVFEGRVGAGKLLVCGFEVSRITGDPAARQWQQSMYAYVASDNFRPETELDPAMLGNIFATPKPSASMVNVRASADSVLSKDFTADKAVDGDPATYWDASSTNGFPHWLKVELPQASRLAGITTLPRLDGVRAHWVRDYAVYVSDDGVNWGDAVAKGSFANDAELKTVMFAKPVTAKFFKFEALNSHTGHRVSLADCDVIVDPAAK